MNVNLMLYITTVFMLAAFFPYFIILSNKFIKHKSSLQESNYQMFDNLKFGSPLFTEVQSKLWAILVFFPKKSKLCQHHTFFAYNYCTLQVINYLIKEVYCNKN